MLALKHIFLFYFNLVFHLINLKLIYLKKYHLNYVQAIVGLRYLNRFMQNISIILKIHFDL